MCVNPYFTQHIFFSSNLYREEHEHSFFFCQNSLIYIRHVHWVFLIFHNFLPDVKRAFDQLPNPPFLFFSSIRPFFMVINMSSEQHQQIPAKVLDDLCRYNFIYSFFIIIRNLVFFQSFYY